jgi:hypothetical protein
MSSNGNDRNIPRNDWADRAPKPVVDTTGNYQPHTTTEYLPNLDYRPTSRH